MRLTWIVFFLLLSPLARGQTVVEMDLQSALQILASNKLDVASGLLSELANNYRKHNAIRVQSRDYKDELAVLARALRTDFDGSGMEYIPELTVWAIYGNTGGQIFLVSSLLDPGTVLLSTDLDYIKGMLAFEIIHKLRRGDLGLAEARLKARAVGIEMQVNVNQDGDRTISFFGHTDADSHIVGKLAVIEPPDFMWK